MHNDNLGLLFQEIEKNPDNLFSTLIEFSECFEETDLDVVYADWSEMTKIFLKKLKYAANKVEEDTTYSIELIDDVLAMLPK